MMMTTRMIRLLKMQVHQRPSYNAFHAAAL